MRFPLGLMAKVPLKFWCFFLHLLGIVVDAPAAERMDFEGMSSVVGPLVGEGHRHDVGTDRGKQWAKFRPDLLAAGKYEVRLSYTTNPNRATKVPVKSGGDGRPAEAGADQRGLGAARNVLFRGRQSRICRDWEP